MNALLVPNVVRENDWARRRAVRGNANQRARNCGKASPTERETAHYCTPASEEAGDSTRARVRSSERSSEENHEAGLSFVATTAVLRGSSSEVAEAVEMDIDEHPAVLPLKHADPAALDQTMGAGDIVNIVEVSIEESHTNTVTLGDDDEGIADEAADVLAASSEDEEVARPIANSGNYKRGTRKKTIVEQLGAHFNELRTLVRRYMN